MKGMNLARLLDGDFEHEFFAGTRDRRAMLHVATTPTNASKGLLVTRPTRLVVLYLPLPYAFLLFYFILSFFFFICFLPNPTSVVAKFYEKSSMFVSSSCSCYSRPSCTCESVFINIACVKDKLRSYFSI